MSKQNQNITSKNIKKYWKKNWWKHILEILICAIYLLPFYVIVVMSLKDMTNDSSRLSFPNPIYWGNYESVIESGKMTSALINSAIIMISVVALEIVIGCLAAYPLARNHSKGNNLIMNIFLGVMMIPGVSVLVGIYSLLTSIGGTNTYWGIILVNVGFGLPTAIYLYTNFISSIPESLDEAAAIDGASNIQAFFRVIMPQLKPITVTVMILQGVGMWNEYMYSVYILQRPAMFTVTLQISSYFSTNTSSDYGGAAAAAVIGMLPLVIMYVFLQKYFIQGAVVGAVKG